MKKEEKKLQIRNSTAEFLIFTRQAGEDGIEVRVQDKTVWLTQKLMAALFGVDVRTISEHLRNLFDSGELREGSVIRKFRTTAVDGKNYDTQFYNLDATRFRFWASSEGQLVTNCRRPKTGGIFITQPVRTCNRLKTPPNPRNFLPLP
jgi:hypothetical protein